MSLASTIRALRPLLAYGSWTPSYTAQGGGTYGTITTTTAYYLHIPFVSLCFIAFRCTGTVAGTVDGIDVTLPVEVSTTYGGQATTCYIADGSLAARQAGSIAFNNAAPAASYARVRILPAANFTAAAGIELSYLGIYLTI